METEKKIEKGRRKKTRKKYNLSLDPNVIEPLKERLDRQGITLSGFVNAVTAEAWEAMASLPDNIEDMTIKQFNEFMSVFIAKMKE